MSDRDILRIGIDSILRGKQVGNLNEIYQVPKTLIASLDNGRDIR